MHKNKHRWQTRKREDWAKKAGSLGLWASIHGFVGATGTGKSSTLRDCVLHTAQAFPWMRWVVCDFGEIGEQYGEFWEQDGVMRHGYMALPAVASLVYDETNMHQIYERFRSAQFHIIQGEPNPVDVIDLCIKLGGVNLVYDEVWNVAGDEEFAKFCPKNFMRVIRSGRHIYGRYGRGISILWASQTLQQTHKRLVGMSRSLYVHRLQYRYDYEQVTAWSGREYPEIRDLEDKDFNLINKRGLVATKRGKVITGKPYIIKGLSCPTY